MNILYTILQVIFIAVITYTLLRTIIKAYKRNQFEVVTILSVAVLIWLIVVLYIGIVV